MYIRTVQFRFKNPHTMTFAMKKMIEGMSDVYKKHGMLTVTSIQTSEDRLTNVAVWKKNPGNKILEDLELKMRNFSKMYDFTHAIGGGVVKLLWDVEKDWLVADL